MESKKIIIQNKKSIFNGLEIDIEKIYKYLTPRKRYTLNFIQNRKPCTFIFGGIYNSTNIYCEFSFGTLSCSWACLPAELSRTVINFLEGVVECKDCKGIIYNDDNYDDLCSLCFSKGVLKLPENNDICSVCHENMIWTDRNPQEVKYLDCCKNFFHTECLSKIENRKCPICKAEFKKIYSCGCCEDTDEEDIEEEEEQD
jgi:hypothetical protein